MAIRTTQHHPLWPTEAEASQDELFLYPPVVDSAANIQPQPFIFYDTTDYTAIQTYRTRPDHGNPIMQTSDGLATGLILFCFVLLAWIRYNNPRRLSQILKAAFLIKHMHQLQRDGNVFNEQIPLVLSVIFLIAFPLLAYSLAVGSGLFVNIDNNIGLVLAGIAIFTGFMWSLKALLNRILAHLFRTQAATRFYLFNNLIFNALIGLVSLVFLPVIFFSGLEWAVYPAVVVVALLILYKVVRGVMIGSTLSSYPLSYQILYIVVIEVLPLALAGKILYDLNNMSL